MLCYLRISFLIELAPWFYILLVYFRVYQFRTPIKLLKIIDKKYNIILFKQVSDINIIDDTCRVTFDLEMVYYDERISFRNLNDSDPNYISRIQYESLWIPHIQVKF